MLRLSLLGLIALAPLTFAKPDFQKRAEECAGKFEPEKASILYSLTRASTDYTVEIVRKKGTLYDLTIRVLDGKKVLCSFDGHRQTVFAIGGGVLYYAVFNPSASGCTVIAHDLKAGKQLWKTHLLGIGPVEHTKYRNRVTLEIDEGAVLIKGEELFGHYVEYVDLKTGKTVGNWASGKNP
jgi:hypothetical protein